MSCGHSRGVGQCMGTRFQRGNGRFQCLSGRAPAARIIKLAPFPGAGLDESASYMNWWNHGARGRVLLIADMDGTSAKMHDERALLVVVVLIRRPGLASNELSESCFF